MRGRATSLPLAGFAGLLLAAAGCNSEGAPSPVTPGASDAGDEGRRTPPPSVVEPTAITGPARLSETGLYADFGARRLADGIREVAPKFALYSDRAEKKRFVYLPSGATIDTSDMDAWKFPVGTKLWKEFWVDGVLIETRLLEKQPEDLWWMAAYLWRADGTDADANTGGTPNARGTTHDVPSQADCRKCHAGGHDAVLGVSAIQLSNGGAGLLSEWARAGLLSNPPAGEFTVPGTPIQQAAFGVLHANCGHCHNQHSGLHNQSPLRLALRTTDLTAADTGAMKSVSLAAKHIVPPDIGTLIVPGSPEQSQLYVRMVYRDIWQMPPLGTKIADVPGSDAVFAWIKGL